MRSLALRKSPVASIENRLLIGIDFSSRRSIPIHFRGQCDQHQRSERCPTIRRNTWSLNPLRFVVRRRVDPIDGRVRLGIENKVQMSIFRLLSAILHLGNVIINEGDEESTFIQESDRSFATFAALLKIDPSRMRTWLCNKRIKTGVEVVNTTLNLNQVGRLSRTLAADRSSFRRCSLAML